MKECEIWISMNEDGNWVVNADGAADAHEQLCQDIGGEQCRTVKVVVRMSPPAEVECSVEVPDEAGTTATGVAA